jgi:hypothetical protein
MGRVIWKPESGIRDLSFEIRDCFTAHWELKPAGHDLTANQSRTTE